MNTEEIIELRQGLEGWVVSNSKSPMMLFDISQLISILKRYYVMYPKKEMSQ